MVATTICLSLSIILLLLSMTFSTMSSSACQLNNPTTARSYFIWSMAASGLSVIFLIIGLILYLMSK